MNSLHQSHGIESNSFSNLLLPINDMLCKLKDNHGHCADIGQGHCHDTEGQFKVKHYHVMGTYCQEVSNLPLDTASALPGTGVPSEMTDPSGSSVIGSKLCLPVSSV